MCVCPKERETWVSESRLLAASYMRACALNLHTHTHTRIHTHTYTHSHYSLQQTTTLFSTPQHPTVHCNKYIATYCTTLHTAPQRQVAGRIYALQHIAKHYNKLQQTATNCNTLQHTARTDNTQKSACEDFGWLWVVSSRLSVERQCVAVCCSVLQCMQCVAVRCSV